MEEKGKLERVDTAPAGALARAARTPTLVHAVDTFERLELKVKKRSDDTLRWYRERLEKMCRYLGEDRSPASVLDVDLLDWLAALQERDTLYGGGSSRPAEKGELSVATVRGYVRAARRFWRWLWRKRFIEVNPAEELPMPAKPKLAQRGISEANQQAILAAAKPFDIEASEIPQVRDFAILCFLAATGCRLGGLAHLTLDDLNLDEDDERLRRRVYVIEKGSKGRYVFLDLVAEEALIVWLKFRPAAVDRHVFVGKANGTFEWSGLKEGGIYEIVKKYADKAGVRGKGVRWSPHQWRHRFGRRWLERGGDLSRLAQVMGHSTSQITSDHYGQLEVDVLQDGYDEIMW